VWIGALRQVCLENGIFEPTFPIKDMSRLELEHAVTTRNRFVLHVLQRALLSAQALRTIFVRIIVPPSSARGADSPIFTDVVLIPGGRFLITATLTEFVQLWDLGFAPLLFRNDRPLAVAEVGNLDSDCKLLTYPTLDGNGILLLVVTSTERYGTCASLPLKCNPHLVFSRRKVSVLSINPVSDKPMFDVVASFQFHEDDIRAGTSTLTGDRVAFYGGGLVIVWNFVCREWTKWKYEPTVFDTDTFQW
jgi:hypothetical protein